MPEYDDDAAKAQDGNGELRDQRQCPIILHVVHPPAQQLGYSTAEIARVVRPRYTARRQTARAAHFTIPNAEMVAGVVGPRLVRVSLWSNNRLCGALICRSTHVDHIDIVAGDQDIAGPSSVY